MILRELWRKDGVEHSTVRHDQRNPVLSLQFGGGLHPHHPRYTDIDMDSWELDGVPLMPRSAPADHPARSSE